MYIHYLSTSNFDQECKIPVDVYVREYILPVDVYIQCIGLRCITSVKYVTKSWQEFKESSVRFGILSLS